jgi:uncharacterized protein (TIGR04255 family)
MPHYRNAPITEAVLDLRVAPRPDLKVEELAKVIAGDEVAYPTVEAMNAVTGSMMVTPVASATNTVTTHIGFVFRHKDGRYLHQARLDGFTLSELPKYSRWQDLRDEAFRRWSQYRDIVRPAGVRRAALRYVNRIDVPEPLTDIESYLRTYPFISDSLPQMIDGYFLQLGIPLQKIGGRATITEAIIQPQRPGIVSIVLDIDVFKEYSTPASEQEAWSMLDQIRDIKNDIFEACITDKTRELFA